TVARRIASASFTSPPANTTFHPFTSPATRACEPFFAMSSSLAGGMSVPSVFQMRPYTPSLRVHTTSTAPAGPAATCGSRALPDPDPLTRTDGAHDPALHLPVWQSAS